jgi:hypothetical protein
MGTREYLGFMLSEPGQGREMKTVVLKNLPLSAVPLLPLA